MGELLGEKCAVAGAVSTDPELDASQIVYQSLRILQHRGEEASGIASQVDSGDIHKVRAHGYVLDVFSDGAELERLPGSLAIGHNRYSTDGDPNLHLQPVIDKPLGFAFSHNGNLPDVTLLDEYLSQHNIKRNGMNDSEMMGHTIAQSIRSGADLAEAVASNAHRFTGAYAALALHDGVVAAFRDPNGIRPLSIANFNNNPVVASETCVFDVMSAQDVSDVQPGEIVLFDGASIERIQFADPDPKLDIFEIVYFARPDSTLYGRRVSAMRTNSGEELAIECPPFTDDLDNIIVVPVPDTSVYAAEGYANALGLQHGQAIIKDRYSGSGRSFIAANQQLRKELLKIKHTFLPERITGKDVIVVDDSVVRGNTLPRIVTNLHALGAKSVTCLIASPPVRFPDHYGIDTPEQSELIAANLTPEQIRVKIGCDYLGYLSLSGLIKATGHPADLFNLASFNGEYPIDVGKDNRKRIYTPVSMEYAA